MNTSDKNRPPENQSGPSDYENRRKPSYTAFISYRHCPLDMYAAKIVQQQLEHYTIPKKLRISDERKHIDHIFRDEDELSTSSALSDSLIQALTKSEYLLLICTPRTKESKWVDQEIEEFTRMHGRDHIIAVLAEGEPDESFPEALTMAEDPDHPGEKIYIEPLAADIRGETRTKMKKKLKKEKMRILSTLMDVPYDALVQRDREYRNRKFLQIGTAIFVCLCFFTTYILYQNIQITDLYQKSERTNAIKSAQLAMQDIQTGDVDAALNNIVETSYAKEHPLLSEQEYALSSLLNLYTSGISASYSPYRKLPVNQKQMRSVSYSPSGHLAAYVDRSDSAQCRGYIASMEQGKVLFSFTAWDLNDEFYYGNGAQQVNQVFLIDDETALVLVDTVLLKVDIPSHSVSDTLVLFSRSEKKKILSSAYADGAFWSLGPDFLLSVNAQEMKIQRTDPVSLSEYTIVQSVKAEKDRFAAVIEADSINRQNTGEQTSAAMSLENLETEEETGSADSANASPIILLVAERQSNPVEVSVQGEVPDLEWCDEGLLILERREDEDLAARVQSDAQAYEQATSLRIYADETLGEPFASSAQLYSFGDNALTILPTDHGEIAAMPCYNQVILANPKTKTIVDSPRFKGPVTQVLDIDSTESYGVLINGQEYGVASYEEYAGMPDRVMISYLLQTDLDLTHLTFCQESQDLVAEYIEDEAAQGFITFKNRLSAPEEIYPFAEVSSISESTLRDGSSILLCTGSADKILSSLTDTQICDQAMVFDADTFELIAVLSMNKVQQANPAFCTSVSVESTEEGDWLIWSDGADLIRTPLTSPDEESSMHEPLDLNAFEFFVPSPDGKKVLLIQDTQAEIMQDSPDDGFVLTQDFDLSEPVRNAQWSKDGRYVILNSLESLAIWDTQEANFVEIDGTETISKAGYGKPGFRMGSEHSWIGLYQDGKGSNDETVLKIIDLDQRKTIAEITADDLGVTTLSRSLPSPDGFDFTDHDAKLIIRTLGLSDPSEAEKSALCLYDLESGKITDRYILESDQDASMFPTRIQSNADGSIIVISSPVSNYTLDINDGVREEKSLLFTIRNGSIERIASGAKAMQLIPQANALAFNRHGYLSLQKVRSADEMIKDARILFPDDAPAEALEESSQQ